MRGKGWFRLVGEPSTLSETILKNYFRHSNFSSFQRQLNYSGYYKISGKGRLERCVYKNKAFPDDGSRPPLPVDALLRLRRKSNGAEHGEEDYEEEDDNYEEDEARNYGDEEYAEDDRGARSRLAARRKRRNALKRHGDLRHSFGREDDSEETGKPSSKKPKQLQTLEHLPWTATDTWQDSIVFPFKHPKAAVVSGATAGEFADEGSVGAPRWKTRMVAGQKAGSGSGDTSVLPLLREPMDEILAGELMHPIDNWDCVWRTPCFHPIAAAGPKVSTVQTQTSPLRALSPLLQIITP